MRCAPKKNSQPSSALTAVFLLCSMIGLNGYAVTLLPENYDPSESKPASGIYFQEEELAPTPAPTELPPVAEEPSKIILTLHRPEAPINGTILLSQICDIQAEDALLKEELGILELGAAPPPGETTFIYPRRVEASLRKMGFGIHDFEIQGPDRIAIETPSQSVPIEQIEESLKAAYKAREIQEGHGRRYEVTLMRNPDSVNLPEGEIEIEVADFDRPGSGIRNVVLNFIVNGKIGETRSVSVRVYESALTVVAAKDLDEGAVLGTRDLQQKYMPVRDADPSKKTSRKVEGFVGANLKRSVMAGEALSEEDVEWIPIARKGDSVHVVKKVGNVQVSLQGSLDEDLMYVGQDVKVKLKKSKKDAIGKSMPDGAIVIQ